MNKELLLVSEYEWYINKIIFSITNQIVDIYLKMTERGQEGHRDWDIIKHH